MSVKSRRVVGGRYVGIFKNRVSRRSRKPATVAVLRRIDFSVPLHRALSNPPGPLTSLRLTAHTLISSLHDTYLFQPLIKKGREREGRVCLTRSERASSPRERERERERGVCCSTRTALSFWRSISRFNGCPPRNTSQKEKEGLIRDRRQTCRRARLPQQRRDGRS